MSETKPVPEAETPKDLASLNTTGLSSIQLEPWPWLDKTADWPIHSGPMENRNGSLSELQAVLATIRGK